MTFTSLDHLNFSPLSFVTLQKLLSKHALLKCDITWTCFLLCSPKVSHLVHCVIQRRSENSSHWYISSRTLHLHLIITSANLFPKKASNTPNPFSYPPILHLICHHTNNTLASQYQNQHDFRFITGSKLCT